METGAGVDNLDYIEAKGLLYASAAKSAQITVAHVDDKGVPTLVATRAAQQGARNAVADRIGRAYVPDPSRGTLLVVGLGNPEP